MSIINYAVEVYLNNNTYTDTAHGLVSGVFRFITGRPEYSGAPTYPVYGPDEIDTQGNIISNDNNTNQYFQDFLLKDGLDNNAIRSIDITSSGAYGNNASFGFKLRGDKISSTYFWEFCSNNSIVLTNATVIFYVIIDGVFWQQWQGKISNNPYTENDFSFECKDDATTIHKIMPSYVDEIIKTTSSGVMTETSSVSDSNLVSNPNEPAANQSISQVVVPIVFGDMAFSPVMKLNDQNSFIPLMIDGNGRQSTSCAAFQYNVLVTNPVTSTLSLITTGTYFALNQLSGYFLTVIVGKDANTQIIYKIIGNAITTGESFLGTAYRLTTITIETPLVKTDNTFIDQTKFQSIPGSSTDNEIRYGYYLPTDISSPVPHASENTWWFRISAFSIPTEISTQNFLGNDYSSAQIVKEAAYRFSIFTWDTTSSTYVNISSVVSSNSTGTAFNLISNNATPDGKVSIFEDLGLELKYFCIRSRNLYSLDSPGYMYSLISGTFRDKNSNAGNDIINVTDKSRTTSVQIGPLSGLEDYYLVAGFKINPFSISYDRICFLVDFNLNNTTVQTLVLGGLRYSLFDYNGLLIHMLGNTFTKQSSYVLSTGSFNLSSTFSNLNLIPNDFYYSLPSGDATTFFNNPSGNDPVGQLIPNSLFFDFSNTNLSMDDLNPKSDYVDIVECAIRLNCHSTPPWSGLTLNVKQIALLGSHTIDTISGDLFAKMQGELTGESDTDFGHPTNDIYHTIMHILEDYDGINKNLIKYGNVFNYRSNWHVGRTLVDQQNSIDYLNEICSQSFIGMFGNRHGQRELNVWLQGAASPATTFSPTVHTGKTSIHNSALIIDGSLTGIEKTDFSQVYNSFQLSYNYDAGSKSYTRFINVKVDGISSLPPSTGTDWTKYVSGIGSDPSSWADANNVWSQCRQSYIDNNVVQLPNLQMSELPWFVDASIFDSLATNGTGLTSSAWKYLNFCAYWSTRQKDIVTYNIPITSNTAGTELLDCISFTDDVLTDGITRTGWITSIELDAVNSQYILQVVMQSADMVAAYINSPSGLDERGDSAYYVDSLDETSTNTDSLDER